MEKLLSEIEGNPYVENKANLFSSFRHEEETIDRYKSLNSRAKAIDIFKANFKNLESIRNLTARTVITHVINLDAQTTVYNAYTIILRLIYTLEKYDLMTDEIAFNILNDTSFIEPWFMIAQLPAERESIKDSKSSKKKYTTIVGKYILPPSIFTCLHEFDMNANEAIKLFDRFCEHICNGKELPCVISSNDISGRKPHIYLNDCITLDVIDSIYEKYWSSNLIFKNEDEISGDIYYTFDGNAPYLMLRLLFHELALSKEGRAALFGFLYAFEEDKTIKENATIHGYGEPNFKNQLDLILLPNDCYYIVNELGPDLVAFHTAFKPIFDKMDMNRDALKNLYMTLNDKGNFGIRAARLNNLWFKASDISDAISKIKYIKIDKLPVLYVKIIEDIRSFDVTLDVNIGLPWRYSYYGLNEQISFQSELDYFNKVNTVLSKIQFIYGSISGYIVSAKPYFIKSLISDIIAYCRLRQLSTVDKNIIHKALAKSKREIDYLHNIVFNYGYSSFIDFKLPYNYPGTNDFVTGDYGVYDGDKNTYIYSEIINFIGQHTIVDKQGHRIFMHNTILPFALLNFELFKAAMELIDRPIVYFAHRSKEPPKDTKLKEGCTMNGADDFEKLNSWHSEFYKDKETEFKHYRIQPVEYSKFKSKDQIIKDSGVTVNIIINEAKQILEMWNCYFDYNY